jgi:acetyltransferase-like isoleucine patch superfamily enzyme
VSGYSNLVLIARRFLIPRSFVTLYALLRWRASISTRAEVELGPTLSLGRGTVVSSFCKIKVAAGVLRTGEKCGFACGCFVATGRAGIEIGDHVIFGPNVSVIGVNYRYQSLETPLDEQGLTSIGIRIGRNVWIGANSVILDGTVIGDNCIVAAGSVMNRRFPSNCIIQGNPAKVVLRRAAS